MEPKTIVAIVLIAFIIGGFIFLQKEKQEVSQSSKGRSKNSAPFQYHKEVRNEPSQKD